MTEYEKCERCWHFIELNDADPSEFFKIARFVHLDDGDKEHDHDAAPSGKKHTLDVWRALQPALFHRYPDGKIGPNSGHFRPDYATAWECADDCDTCWYLLSTELLDEIGDDAIAVKLRAHLASGHMLTSEEC